jgi:hypothetical protein
LLQGSGVHAGHGRFSRANILAWRDHLALLRVADVRRRHKANETPAFYKFGILGESAVICFHCLI